MECIIVSLRNGLRVRSLVCVYAITLVLWAQRDNVSRRTRAFAVLLATTTCCCCVTYVLATSTAMRMVLSVNICGMEYVVTKTGLFCNPSLWNR